MVPDWSSPRWSRWLVPPRARRVPWLTRVAVGGVQQRLDRIRAPSPRSIRPPGVMVMLLSNISSTEDWALADAAPGPVKVSEPLTVRSWFPLLPKWTAVAGVVATVPVPATVSGRSRSPPFQLNAPVTDPGPVPPMKTLSPGAVVTDRSCRETAGTPVTESRTALAPLTVTESPVVGTPAGDQLLAVLQAKLVAPVQVYDVTAWAGAARPSKARVGRTRARTMAGVRNRTRTPDGRGRT